ncbi:MAG: hypothetical protein QXT92_00360 [Nitrososphaerota archaeon]
MKVDTSRIDPHLLRPNDLALLSFPQGLVPIRVLNREFFIYAYDPVMEEQIAGVPPSSSTDGISNIGFVTLTKPKSSIMSGRPENVFFIRDRSILYQLFMGIAPSYTQIYVAIPSTHGQKNLELTSWSQSYGVLGYIDGFMSPLLYPSPDSEIILTYKLDLAFAYGNQLYQPISPLIFFYVNRVRFGVILDVDLVMEMLDKRGRGVDTKIKPVGGFTGFTYDFRDAFGIDPIPPTATRREVEVRLKA